MRDAGRSRATRPGSPRRSATPASRSTRAASRSSPRRCGACSTTTRCATGSSPPGLARAAEFTWARTAARDRRRLPRRARVSARRRHDRLARPARPAGATAWRRSRATACRRSCARTCPTAAPSSRARSGFRAYVNERPRTFAQNQNALIAATTEPYVLDPQPRRAARARLRRGARRARRGARALRRRGPAAARERRRHCSARAGASRRSAARSCAARRCAPLVRDVEAAQPGHYLADVPDAPGRVRLDARRLPAAAPRDARRDRRLRRGLPDVRRGHRAAVPRARAPAGSAGTCPAPSRRTTTSASSTARSSRAAPGGTCAAWRATCAGTPRRCCASDATSRARPWTLR